MALAWCRRGGRQATRGKRRGKGSRLHARPEAQDSSRANSCWITSVTQRLQPASLAVHLHCAGCTVGEPWTVVPAVGSDAQAGCAHVAGRLLLRSSAASCAVAVRTSRLWQCWPASSNRGPSQREAVKHEAVKLASTAASGKAATAGGATASITGCSYDGRLLGVNRSVTPGVQTAQLVCMLERHALAERPLYQRLEQKWRSDSGG